MTRSGSGILLAFLLFGGGLANEAHAQRVGDVPPVTVEAGDLVDVQIPWQGDTFTVVTATDGCRVIRQVSDDPKVLLLGVLGRKPGTYEAGLVASACEGGKAKTVVVKLKITVTGPAPVPPSPGPGPNPNPPPPNPGPVPPLPPDNPPDDTLPPFVPPDNFRATVRVLSDGDRLRLAEACIKVAADITRCLSAADVRKALAEAVAASGVDVPAGLALQLGSALENVGSPKSRAALSAADRKAFRAALSRIAVELAK